MNDRTKAYIERKKADAKKQFDRRVYKWIITKNANRLPILLSILGVISPKTFRDHLEKVDRIFYRHLDTLTPSTIEKTPNYGPPPKQIKPTKARR